MLVHKKHWMLYVFFFFIADITPEELFNMFFGGFGGISGGKKKNVSLIK